MTSRVTFGDLAAVAARHLEAPAQQVPGTGRPSSAQAAAEADELLAVLPRMLKTMVRYTTDIATASAAGQGEGPAGTWARAATEAHRAAQYAYRLLPLEEFTGKAWPHRHVTSSLARNVDAAAVAMTAARDLLHTHFRTTADGTRQDRPEWAHLITSAPVQKALLGDLAAWSRHVVSYGSRLTSAASQPGAGHDRGAAQAARHLPVADRPDHGRGNSSQPRAGHHRRHPAAPPHPAQHATPAQRPGPRRDRRRAADRDRRVRRATPLRRCRRGR